MEADFERRMEASTRGLPAETVRELQETFGDQVALREDRIVWKGRLIGQLTQEILDAGDAFAAGDFRGRAVKLGKATRKLSRLAGGQGVDLQGHELVLDPTHIHHLLKRHGEGRETQEDQLGVTRLDVEMIPHVWRDPDVVRLGRNSRTIILEKRILGQVVVVAFSINPPEKQWQVNSMWIKVDVDQGGVTLCFPPRWEAKL